MKLAPDLCAVSPLSVTHVVQTLSPQTMGKGADAIFIFVTMLNLR